MKERTQEYIMLIGIVGMIMAEKLQRGIYFCTLETPKQKLVRKLVIIR